MCRIIYAILLHNILIKKNEEQNNSSVNRFSNLEIEDYRVAHYDIDDSHYMEPDPRLSAL